jgi:type IV pilus assembly protein PilY1
MPPINDYLDRIYIGDIGGQMWRFDVSDSITSSWTGNIIFSAPTAGAGNPIFYPPSLSYDEEDNLWVFFGTGDRENPRDGSSQNRFYGVIDGGTCLGENDIEDITHGPKLPYSNGWYIKLDKGESVLAGTAVLGGTVYFTTYQAVELDDPCAIQGMAKLYKVDFTQGTFTVDTVGTSLPTTPQIIVSPEGKLTIMISLAEGMVHSETSELGSPFKESKYWREIHP